MVGLGDGLQARWLRITSSEIILLPDALYVFF
jgi:hypothetical protein